MISPGSMVKTGAEGRRHRPRVRYVHRWGEVRSPVVISGNDTPEVAFGRNGAPFQHWPLPAAILELRDGVLRKPGGDRQSPASEVRMLLAVVVQRWSRATVHDLQDRV
jgi:hypothetical protein